MGRSLTGLCATTGLILGGYLPAIWGAGLFSLSSLVFSLLGGIAGLWLGIRLSDY